jgi:hypothetical protein
MHRRFLLVTVMSALVMLAGSTSAHAQDPAGCTGNRPQLDILKDRTHIRDGETIRYWIAIANDAPNSCTVSSLNVRMQLPDAFSGDPGAFLPALTNNLTMPFPTAEIVLGPYGYQVNFGPNPPARYTARASIVDGRLRDIPPPYSVLDIDRTLQTLTVQPILEIEKTGSTVQGPAPLTVDYRYTVRNRTKVAVPLLDKDTEIRNVVPTDDKCGPLKLLSGDTNLDSRLQISETWTYGCTSTFVSPGTYTNTTYVCGDNVIDNIPKKVCSPPDTWTVVVTPPPAAPPQGSVKPVSAAQSPCELATASSIKLRAKELTTIRVRTRSVDAGTKVTITLPGGKKVTEKVGKDNIALFHVRPTQSGNASIKAAECSDVEKLTVRPARQVVTRRVPRVTG